MFIPYWLGNCLVSYRDNLLVILGILLIIDIFLIPGRVNQLNGVTPFVVKQ